MKGIDPRVQVSLSSIINARPGDPCPAEDCDGYFKEITISWSKDMFLCDAECSKCGNGWCLAEQHAEEEEVDDA